jgi:hypothetical protein
MHGEVEAVMIRCMNNTGLHYTVASASYPLS